MQDKEIEEWFEEWEKEREERQRKLERYSQERYVEKYDLEPNPILPKEEFIQRDERFDHFTGDLSFLEIQDAIAHVKLIPPVPDEIKDIFQTGSVETLCVKRYAAL